MSNEAIEHAVTALGITHCSDLSTDKYFQLQADTLEQYENARAYLLLFGLNVGEARYSMMMDWYLFRAYVNGDDVDVKSDLDY